MIYLHIGKIISGTHHGFTGSYPGINLFKVRLPQRLYGSRQTDTETMAEPNNYVRVVSAHPGMNQTRPDSW
jgi:hypothetical protein